MNTELITGFAAGVTAAAVAGGLTAAWTANKLIGAKRRQLAVEPEVPERDEQTGISTQEGFVKAVEDFAVTAALTNQPTNHLILLECSGLDEVEDTYGPGDRARTEVA